MRDYARGAIVTRAKTGPDVDGLWSETTLMLLDAVPAWPVMVAYTAACAVLFLTPGPDMSLFLARTISSGRSHGIAAMLGALSGCLVHTLLAAIGVSALLAASKLGFLALKFVGALYLFWLAIDAIRNGSVMPVGRDPARRVGLWTTYLTGVGVNLTNPKIVLFFVTFLPQFVVSSDPAAKAKLVFLGLYFVAFSLPLAVLMIALAHHLIDWLRRQPIVLRGLDLTFAGIFGAFALKILLTDAPDLSRR